MLGRRFLILLGVAAIGIGTGAPAARAQSTEFRLDSSGKWEQVSSPRPGTEEALIAEARKALADDRADDAKEILDDWLEKNENSDNPLMPQALLLRGDARTALGNEHTALYDYEDILKRFQASPEYVTANERELEIAVRYVNGMRYKWLGLRIWGASDIGEEMLIRIQERLPGSRLAERAGIELADYYYRERDLKMSAIAYEKFIQNYPDSPYRMKAMERQVYSAIGQFKGPNYDASPLADAKVLIKRFGSLYPAEAQQAGLDDALVTRLDESAASSQLEAANWYIGHGDPVSARYVLRRMIQKYRGTSASETGLKMMADRGWLIQAPPPAAPPGEPQPTQAPGGAPPESAEKPGPAPKPVPPDPDPLPPISPPPANPPAPQPPTSPPPPRSSEHRP